MSCFSCFGSPPEAGVEDSQKPNAFRITVRLSTGYVAPCWALPTDTIEVIKRKIEEEHGVQPLVGYGGRMIPPYLCAKYQGKWVMVIWSATMQDIGLQTELKFADITDKLKEVKAFSHIHWAVTHIVT